MAELLLHHFTQEMVLFQLEQDMGEQLEERYGEHFGLIQSEYLNAEPEAEAQEDKEDQAASPITRPLSEDEGDPEEEVNGNSNRNTA